MLGSGERRIACANRRIEEKYLEEWKKSLINEVGVKLPSFLVYVSSSLYQHHSPRLWVAFPCAGLDLSGCSRLGWPVKSCWFIFSLRTRYNVDSCSKSANTSLITLLPQLVVRTTQNVGNTRFYTEREESLRDPAEFLPPPQLPPPCVPIAWCFALCDSKLDLLQFPGPLLPYVAWLFYRFFGFST